MVLQTTKAVRNGQGSPYSACLDSATGEVIWQRTDFVCNHFRGAGSSPFIYKDLLIRHFDGSDFQYVVAMNKKTGETVWRTDRSVDYDDIDLETGRPIREGDFRKAFSTPVIAQVDGRPVIGDGVVCLGSPTNHALRYAQGSATRAASQETQESRRSCSSGFQAKYSRTRRPIST